MNLYIFNETRRGTIYGVGTYLFELTNALKDCDMNICVVNLFSNGLQILTEKIENTLYWYFPFPIVERWSLDIHKQRQLYYRNIVYLLQLRIKDKNDLIFHLNYQDSESLVEELRSVFNCRIVTVVHFSDWGFKIFDNLQRLRFILNEKSPNSFDAELKRKFEEERLFYSKMDHCICLSNYMREILCRDYGLDTTKVSVIANGLRDVVNPLINNKFLRKKWNIKPKENIILFVGRIDEVKGLSYLINAFREVLKIKPNSRLLLAGSGNYDIFFQEAKDICTKITFTGFLDKEELYEIYRIANVGVMPSLFEPFGYVPVEMMMHELPIIATATSGLNEVVDETCGLKIPLIKYHNSVEIDINILAESILYLLRYPKRAHELGENGRKKYEKMYSSEIFGQKMFHFYRLFVL